VPFQPLKKHIVELMARRGVCCSEAQIFLTSGAQHALSLLAHIFLEPEGQVLMEETVYDGLQMAIKPFQPEILTVPTDLRDGINLKAVEALLAEGARPAFIYVIPEGHNPLGVSMSFQKRAALVELARRYRVPVIEDDAYGFLCYDGAPNLPLRALDEDWVFYVGSFSKILAPALRVGWVIVPESLMPLMSIAKHTSDMDVSTITQRIVSNCLDTGFLPAHIVTLQREYRVRRDAMLCALNKHFPADVCWTKPGSGMFIWVELPVQLNAIEVLKCALESERVAFIPGQAFCATEGQHASNCLRLNFTNCSLAGIEEGIARLSRTIRDVIDKHNLKKEQDNILGILPGAYIPSEQRVTS
jgi:2-aminoadipate transaminase